MISFIRGQLAELGTETAIVDVNGIGYEVSMHQRAMRAMPALGQEVTIYTRMQISDNDVKLYGFLSGVEMELFQRLNMINGIGPRVALAVLGRFAPDEFYRAVSFQDLKALMTVPGIGKKNAERLVFELKDRIPVTGAVDTVVASEAEALWEALQSLGYSRGEVFPHILSVLNSGEKHSLEDNLRMVLKSKGLRKG